MTSSQSNDSPPAAFPSSVSPPSSSNKGGARKGYWKLSFELRGRMQQLVDRMLEDAKAKCLLVITDSGSSLISSGRMDGVDGIAALGVGAYHAMSRLMSLCGLGEGRTIYQQSEHGGVLMAALSEGVIVVLVLEDVLSPGLARFVLQREVGNLEGMIAQALGK